MAEYGIKEEDENESVLYMATIDAKKKFFYYEKMFMAIIRKLSGVYIIREAQSNGYYLVNAYGTTEQVLFAYETYIFLQNSIYQAYVKERMKGYINLDQFSFYTGLSDELYNRICLAEDQNISKALVISYEGNAEKYKEIFEPKHIRMMKNFTRYSSASSFDRGKEAAKNIQVSKMKKGGNVKKIEGPKS